MSQELETLETTTFNGKRFTRKQLAQIQETVDTFSALSRRELGHTLCEHFQWITPKGSHRIQYCLGALEEMEKIGIIKLPAKINNQKHVTQKKIIWTDRTKEQQRICCSLDDLMPINVQTVTEKEDILLWNEFVDRHHYLGYRRPIGNHLRYFISKKQDGKILGCMLFSSAVLSLPCRDQWIGWSEKDRRKRLNWILNNNRFLILPWIKVKNLASKVLSAITFQIADDWEQYNGYRPVLLETFIDPAKYKGTCYQAANWQYIGKTAEYKSARGWDKKNISPKDFYVYPLSRDFRSVLNNEKKPAPIAKRLSFPVLSPKHNMSPDDPFIQLWQKIIDLVVNVADEFDQKWQKRKRVLNTMLIILFIFRLVFSKNKQGYGSTIAELWDQCHMMNVSLPQVQPVAPSAFCNARSKLDESIFKTLNTTIIRTYENGWSEYKWNHHRVFAVDGTKINLPRPMRFYGYSTPSDNAYYPQALVSCLYQLKSKIPYDFDLVVHKDERKVALSHLSALRPNDVVVYDRGYYSYAMLYYHIKRGIHAVFRLPNNTHKVINEFMVSNDTDKVVEIEPSPNSQRDIISKNPDIDFVPLKLRLIKYIISGTTYTLGTTLIDSSNYKTEEFADLYHSRWGVEELYKISKVLIDVEDFHGQSERGVKQELFAHFVLITLNRIFANQAEEGFTQKHNNSSIQEENSDTLYKFKVNFKNCLITVARNMESLFIQQAKIVQKTINKIITFISINRQKERPNRTYKRQSMKPIKKWRPSKVKNITPIATT